MAIYVCICIYYLSHPQAQPGKATVKVEDKKDDKEGKEDGRDNQLWVPLFMHNTTFELSICHIPRKSYVGKLVETFHLLIFIIDGHKTFFTRGTSHEY